MSSNHFELLETFQKQDAERHSFTEKLIHEFEDLQLRYAAKCEQYRNAIEAGSTMRTAAASYEKALADLKRSHDSNCFVLLIIDGDGAIFEDQLLAKGKEGGAEAAQQLRNSIKSHLRITFPESNVEDWSIMVHVVLNLHGLARKLQSSGVISSVHDLYEFAQAFGLAHGLFNFIDVGSGKERADHKVRETLRVFVPNAQCKHVFFGPCHDNGYLVVLEGYRDQSSKITLLSTRPAESGFQALGFPIVKFPKVFRTMDLPSESRFPLSAVTSTPFRSNTGNGSASTPTVSRTAEETPAANSWATVSRSKSPGKTIELATRTEGKPTKQFMLLNEDDERLDAPLPSFDYKAEQRFYDHSSALGKPCNDFHLRGTCRQGPSCPYRHGERMGPAEQLVLRHKARTLSCASLGDCRDFTCTFGHVCKFARACTNASCWFSSTHGMDTIPAKKLYDDWSIERLK